MGKRLQPVLPLQGNLDDFMTTLNEKKGPWTQYKPSGQVGVEQRQWDMKNQISIFHGMCIKLFRS